MKDNSCAVVDELYSYLDSQKAFKAGFNLSQTLSSNIYTPQEVLDMWGCCRNEFINHYRITYTYDEFCIMEDEKMLAFLVMLGVEI